MNFKSALKKACRDFNKEILFDKRIISILDDYGVFKEEPFIKLFYRIALNSSSLRQFISTNRSERDKYMSTFVTINGLDENKAKTFLSTVFDCYHEVGVDKGLIELQNKTSFDAYCQQNGYPDLCISKKGNFYLFFPEIGKSVFLSKRLRQLTADELEKKCHFFEIADVVCFNENREEIERIPCAYLSPSIICKEHGN